jgi:hypothetical protein
MMASPAYTQGCEEVRLEMKKEEQRFVLMLARAEEEENARLARLSGKYEEWVQVEVSGAEEWASDVVWDAHIEAECVDVKQALVPDEDEDVDDTEELREWYCTEDEGHCSEDCWLDNDDDDDALASTEEPRATVAKFVFDYTG